MIVGFEAPLPPARTGVADYAGVLLGALKSRGDVRVAPRHADTFLYHLGNNQLHREIYRRALARPGVVVLHDAVLQHFFLGSLTEREYVDEFVYNYGEWKRDLARELWRSRASSGQSAIHFNYPMLKRIAGVSRAVVVHNPGAARIVREHAPEARVVEIPHLFEPPPPEPLYEVLRLRAAWGLRPSDTLFAVFGYLRESKRLAVVLRVFDDIRRMLPGSALLVAGSFVSSDLKRALTDSLRRPGIIRLNYLAPRDFHLAAAAVDVCINLRYPAAGETSGISIRMMGIGKPVMMTSGLETSRYPEASFFGVAAGLDERSTLTSQALLAGTFAEIAREVGGRGAHHVREHHDLNRVADEYWSVLHSV